MCQTFQVQQNVLKIAEEIVGTKTLRKLSEGDMIAIEAKWYCKCMVLCYKKSKNEVSPCEIQQENALTSVNVEDQCCNEEIQINSFKLQ